VLHQIVGFLAIGVTGAVLLRAWGAPTGAMLAFCSLGLAAALAVGLSEGGARVEPGVLQEPTMAEQMAPTEGFVAPMRRREMLAVR
jgi:hypothetical protein